MLKEDEILRLIQDDYSSKKKCNARKGLSYYESEHDIKDYKLYYVDADGKVKEDKTRSNIKISHPFFTELVDQQVQYMLSGKGAIVTSDDAILQKELDEYFDDDFKSELQECLTGACAKGFEYMYSFKSTADKTKFMTADSAGVVEVSKNDSDDDCEYFIYYYTETIGKDKKEIKKIQVWDEAQTYFYVQTENTKIKLDENVKINPLPHVVYTEVNDDSTYYDSLGYIPFFRLDNNKKQISGLKAIKGLIDDYDLMACGLSNNLQDLVEGIYVVKGFAGDDLDEMIHNTKIKKHVGVSEDGDLDIRTIDIPYEARKVKLELDEKNIYRFGMGFNSAQLGDGNITNIVIKSRYALLDLKSNKLEMRLKQFLRKLITVALNEINAMYSTGYTIKNVKIMFEREVMTNAKDNADIRKVDAETQGLLLNNILNVAAKLDNETIVEAICEILDINYEEIKDKITQAPQNEVQTIQNTLGSMVSEGKGGVTDESQTS